MQLHQISVCQAVYFKLPLDLLSFGHTVQKINGKGYRSVCDISRLKD